MHPGEKIPRLTKIPSSGHKYNHQLAHPRLSVYFRRRCFFNVIPHLERLLLTRHYMDRIARKACLQLRTWTAATKAVSDTATSRPQSSVSFYELIAKLSVHFDLENEAYDLLLDANEQAIF